jgi:3-hydroxyacyl-[acyl-carrier-protein] dehydratase
MMDIHQILKQLPHRYPFLLVDRVLELEKGKRIKALKNVTINEPFFMGHFPHRPVMPGVLMLEAMAQAAALLAFDTVGVTPDDKTVYYFAGIDGARFKRPVEPGDQLVMDVSLDRMKAGIFKFKGVTRVGEDSPARPSSCAPCAALPTRGHGPSSIPQPWWTRAPNSTARSAWGRTP